MKILVVGGGGREHALTWKISQSPMVDGIWCAPGNAGMARLATCMDIDAEDIEGMADFARDEGIDLTVVGPEAPLVAGIAGLFRESGLAVFGPGREAAQMEGSKA
ncbi:MAG: phosphoribosylamine--glycine ligase, partial [Actinomycetota bacterium]